MSRMPSEFGVRAQSIAQVCRRMHPCRKTVVAALAQRAAGANGLRHLQNAPLAKAAAAPAYARAAGAIGPALAMAIAAPHRLGICQLYFSRGGGNKFAGHRIGPIARLVMAHLRDLRRTPAGRRHRNEKKTLTVEAPGIAVHLKRRNFLRQGSNSCPKWAYSGGEGSCGPHTSCPRLHAYRRVSASWPRSRLAPIGKAI